MDSDDRVLFQKAFSKVFFLKGLKGTKLPWYERERESKEEQLDGNFVFQKSERQTAKRVISLRA